MELTAIYRCVAALDAHQAKLTVCLLYENEIRQDHHRHIHSPNAVVQKKAGGEFVREIKPVNFSYLQRPLRQ